MSGRPTITVHRARDMARWQSALVAPTLSHANPPEGGVRFGAQLSGATGTHTASQWQITTLDDPGFLSPIYDSGADSDDLAGFWLAGVPALDQNYLARMRMEVT